MKRLAGYTLLLALALSGCSVHNAVELRPYTAEETRELAFEDLNRRGLSYEEYQSKKAALLAEPNLQRVHEFDNRGEINAEHVVARPSREG